jgi:hypothetical protein
MKKSINTKLVETMAKIIMKRKKKMKAMTTNKMIQLRNYYLMQIQKKSNFQRLILKHR